MSSLRWLRLKAQQITGIVVLLFLISFGLQSSQDILSNTSPAEIVSSVPRRFVKDNQQDHQKLNQIDLSSDDQSSASGERDLKSLQNFTVYFCFESNLNVKSARNIDFSEISFLGKGRELGLFLQNRALLI